MSTKELHNLTNEELLEYKEKLDKIYEKLKYEVDNWIATSEQVREELKLRKQEIDFELSIIEKHKHTINPSEVEEVLKKLDNGKIRIH